MSIPSAIATPRGRGDHPCSFRARGIAVAVSDSHDYLGKVDFVMPPNEDAHFVGRQSPFFGFGSVCNGRYAERLADVHHIATALESCVRDQLERFVSRILFELILDQHPS